MWSVTGIPILIVVMIKDCYRLIKIFLQEYQKELDSFEEERKITLYNRFIEHLKTIKTLCEVKFKDEKKLTIKLELLFDILFANKNKFP